MLPKMSLCRQSAFAYVTDTKKPFESELEKKYILNFIVIETNKSY